MKQHHKTNQDIKSLSQSNWASGEKTLLVILLLDVIALFWLFNFDKVIQFLSWALGK